MRTTLNIDDDVLRAAKELARLRGSTAGAIVSELARETLARERPSEGPAVRNGVPLLPDRPGVGIVTPEGLRALQGDP